jgi:hypothetical protein
MSNMSKPTVPVFGVRRSASNEGWVAVNGEGRQVSESFGSRSQAEAWSLAAQKAADLKAKRGPRACMCCGKQFASQGIHNRLCNPCRGRDEGLLAVRPYIDTRG